jgi:hypothetical protein
MRMQFPAGAVAIENGSNVLHLIQRQSSQAEQALRPFVGKRVVLAGWGGGYVGPGRAEPVNLAIGGVSLKVNFAPYKDPHPRRAISFDASVLGILREFDYQGKVLWIDARPDDWKLRVAF